MKREVDLRSIKMDINVGADVENVSKMLLVFDAERPTELFNALAQAVKDIEDTLKHGGILTDAGVGTGEMDEYLKYMEDIVIEKEESIYLLYHVLKEVKGSGFQSKYILEQMIQEKIDEHQEVVDKYYDMFKDINYVEVTNDNIDDFIKKESE